MEAAKSSFWSNLSIALKTALISCLVVFTLLAAAAVFFISIEANLIELILAEYDKKIATTLSNQAKENEAALQVRHTINAKISGGMAGYFVYNFDQEGLKNNLKNLLELPDVIAVQVQDSDNKAFLALWKEGGVTASGDKIAEGKVLDSGKNFSADIVYDKKKIGSATLYYTDQLLVQQMAESRNALDKEVELLRRTIREKIEHTTYFQVMIFGVVILILIITIALTLRIIVVKRMKTITAGLRAIAEGEGDLTKRLDSKYNDEIGELSKWFNVFVDKMHIIIADVKKCSEELGGASNSLAGLSDTMTGSAKKTSAMAGIVSDASSEMSGNMNSVAAAMEETATNINMVAAASEEMNTTINEIAENTAQALKITVNAVEQTKSASQQVDELGAAAKGIEKVLETISEISDQVNLLALNATIEAARAGDAGKGFAVVANEIKDLANQTAQATGQIRGKIEGIQATTQGTVSQIERIAKVVSEVSDIVATISSAIEEQSSATKEIAMNVSQASEGVTEVNRNVAQSNLSAGNIAGEIGEVTTAAAEMSESSTMVSQSAEKLAALSSQLTSLVQRFKV